MEKIYRMKSCVGYIRRRYATGRNTHRNSVGKPEGRRQPRNHTSIGKDNIKMDFIERGWNVES
jgi:hypothetical protein